MLAGYPEAVPYGGIKGAYEYLKVDVDGSCLIWWPTSFGEADLSYAAQPGPYDCSNAEQLARAMYPNLSR